MKTYRPHSPAFALKHCRSNGEWVPAEVAQQLYDALHAYHHHFGILEDNSFVNEEARRCCHLARKALAAADGDSHEDAQAT